MKQKTGVVAAITAAVIAYLEEEQQAKVAITSPKPAFEVSPWRLFGRQELMRSRIHWRRRIHRK